MSSLISYLINDLDHLFWSLSSHSIKDIGLAQSGEAYNDLDAPYNSYAIKWFTVVIHCMHPTAWISSQNFGRLRQPVCKPRLLQSCRHAWGSTRVNLSSACVSWWIQFHALSNKWSWPLILIFICGLNLERWIIKLMVLCETPYKSHVRNGLQLYSIY